MSNNFVQVPPNSSGVKLQTFENTISANVVDAEAMVPVDPAGLAITANPGSAAPSSGILVGGSDGTNLRAVATDTGGQVKVLVENSPTVAATESGAWNVNQTLGTPGFEAITDGTNGPAAVKAASTAAVATDKALVVAVSPNNTIPVSNASLPLPTGASTSAKQPALGTAGTPSADVISVQGESGMTPVLTAQGTLAEATAAWTSATTVNTALQLNVGGYGSVIVTLNQGTTLTAGAVTYEVSDTTAFTNAYPIQGVYTNSSITGPVLTTGLAANTNYSLTFNTAGWAAFRVRLSTIIAGTATVNVGIQASAASANVTGHVFLDNSSVAVIATVKSAIAAAAPVDNIANVNFLPSATSVADPLYVAEAIYGGAFSGTGSASQSGWTKRRAPTVFKTVQATASGNTAVWTPGSGNKFRLLKLFVELTDNASLASGGVLTISFQDATTAMPIAFDVFVPTTAVTTTIGDGLEQQLDLGDFGIQSATANNALNVNLSAALVTGNVRVIAMGSEE